MTSTEDTEKTTTNNDESPSSPEGKTRKSTQRIVRSQYLKLHRSLSTPGSNSHIQSLKSVFEQTQLEPEKIEDAAALVPKQKEGHVDKVEELKVVEDVVDQSSQQNEEGNPFKETNVVEDKANPFKEEQSNVALASESVKVKLKPKKVLKKSFSTDEAKLSQRNKAKRVSFSEEVEELKPKGKPVPKPRTNVPNQILQVTVEEHRVEPDSAVVEKVILNQPNTSDVNSNYLTEGEVEERSYIFSATPLADSIENIKEVLDSFEMDTKKKRSNSFRSKLLTIFTKDKDKKPKDKEDNKKTKKTENAVFADNAQNESFNRHSTQRHTMDVPRRDAKQPTQNHQIHQQNLQLQQQQQKQHEIENRYAAMHINNFQQTRSHFTNQQTQHLLRELPPQPLNFNPSEDYVCMDKNESKNNYINVPKYDSSSTNTIESENSTTSVNPLQQIQQERMAIRTKFFSDTPPRAQDTNQPVQLVKPKAAIPISSERALPNPYQQQQLDNEFGDGVYGTVYDRNARPMSAGESSDVSSMSSPRSPSVERTKLKLPPNRERVDLQPRIKSPIPHNEISTDKLIATELLKNTNKKKDQRSSPSHQKLELEIDYPEDSISEVVEQTVHSEIDTSINGSLSSNHVIVNISELQQSRETLIEAGDWHRVQRDLASSPSLKNVQITTNATVHVDSPQRASTPSQDGRSRSVTPVMTTRSSNTSLQRSPPKHEIRQSVEAFCWKELKKMKEKEDQQMQILISSCGYAEDPIRRSRSMAPTQRDTKRSTSLPRDVVRQRRSDDAEMHARRMAQQQRFNRLSPQRSTIAGMTGGPARPIFNRGSLTHQGIVDQPIYNKKVSFHSPQNPQNPTSWPIKNGFTQSPPQRRLDQSGKPRDSLEDEVFLPTSPQEAPAPSRDEIFLLNQQRQKELLLAKAQRNMAPVQTDSGNPRSSPISDQTTVDGSVVVVNDVPPMRTIREPIYGTRPTPTSTYGPVNQSNNMVQESPYGTRTNNESAYGTRVVNENIYVTKNGIVRSNESPYGARINDGSFSSRNSSINETAYGARTPNESPYGSRVVMPNESPYGTRTTNESPYGIRPPMVRSPNEYPARNANDGRLMNENPYGIRQMYQPNMQPIQEPIYGTKQPQEPIYGSRTSVINRESQYGARPMPNIPRQENPYGTRPTGPPRFQSSYQESPYGTRQSPNGEPIYGSRMMPNGSMRAESPYGTRPMGPMGPQYYGRPPGPPHGPQGVQMRNGPPGLKRSNSLRQPVSPETLYGGRPNFNKPPTGAHPRQPRSHTMEPSPPGQQGPQGRYDFPPDSPPRQSLQTMQQEPIYGGRRVMTVNNKVCDMYGKIHDGSAPPMSPPPAQKAGVLYGQLQRNSNAGPMQYQSYQQLQPNDNFTRGTRLTASVNDMNRYNSNANVTQRNEPPNRPLPPIPDEVVKKSRFGFRKKSADNGAASNKKEEWNSDGKRGGGLSGSESGGRSDTDGELRSRSRNNRRDDPRRHTLAGEQYGVMSGQGGPLSRTMDLEGQPRGYPPPSNAMLFDDDPGIMSEVETSSTGFRRGGKQRSSLPVVRTPSKTLERPLGLVFLQYRNETKRALLPNEITSIDTVKALFVRSFPKQLTMEYLDSPQVKIYIHDSSKDMFYELEDLRSHLREIRDRSVLRLFESADVTGGLPMAGIGIAGGAGVPHFEDPSYFSEPEFDSEYQHQHIHKSKGSAKGAPYYIGSTASLPRAGLLRAYSPAVGNLPQDRMKTLPTGAPPKPQRAYSSGTTRSGADGAGARAPDRFAQFVQRPNNSLYNIPDGYMSSPERGSRYEDAYYSQYGARSGSITPVIDEEVSDTELIDDQYSLYGVKMPPPGGPRPAPRTQFSTPAAPPYDTTRIRVENMERQLANLTGLVQKALTQTPATLQVPSTGRDSYRGDDCDMNSSSHFVDTMEDKSVSFEKSVSFSDEPPDMNSPKQHSPQHSADTKPTKPAIKSSTLPRTSSQERDRLKPAPPPKPASLSPGQYDGRHIYRDLQLTPEMYNQLRGLQKKAKDLRAEVRNLRRMSQAQAHSVRETIRDTFIKIRAMLMVGGEQVWQAGMDQERVRLSREEDLYKQEMIRLETDLTDLESTVEELRGNVINRKTRVNMSDVENMALVLSKSSKTVADLKLRFPMLQDGLKTMLTTEMETVVREETFLKEEPERLESALRRCKKLTGTLVTLKRLASVQEQRLPCSATAADGRLSPTEPAPITPTSAQHSKPVAGARVGSLGIGGDAADSSDSYQRPENALDALLDELQTFSKPHTVNTQIPQVSYPPDSADPPTLPVKGIQPSPHNHPPSMHEIGRKGSMDSANILPTQTLTVSTATGSLRRLHSYPSGSDTDNSPPIQPLQRIHVDSNKQSGKPPLPERNADLLQHISTKRVPPPPPPRTSSKSPLASPTSPSLPPRSPASNLQHIQNVQNMVENNKPQSQFEAATQNLGLGTLRRNIQNRSSLKDSSKSQTLPRNIGSNLQIHATEVENAISASNSSSCESVNSQDGTKKRKEELEHRHQELLKKQKALQEQYARLQQLQRGTNTLAVIPPAPDQLLKKTGSESNILQKMGLQLTTSQMTGSLTNLPLKTNANQQNNNTTTGDDTSTSSNTSSNTTNKVYETDIL